MIFILTILFSFLCIVYQDENDFKTSLNLHKWDVKDFTHGVARNNEIRIVKPVLDISGSYQPASFNYAAQNGNLEAMEQFLQCCNINPSDRKPTHFTAQANKMEPMKFLLQDNVFIHVTDNGSISPIHVTPLWQDDVSVYYIDNASFSPLHMTPFLRDDTSVPNRKNSSSSPVHVTPFGLKIDLAHTVMRKDERATVKPVFDSRACYQSKNGGLNLSIYLAAEIKKSEALEVGASMDGSDNHDNTTLLSVESCKSVQVMEALLKCGRSVSYTRKIMKPFLKHSASVIARAAAIYTPFHYASRRDDIETVSLLFYHMIFVANSSLGDGTFIDFTSKNKKMEPMKVLQNDVSFQERVNGGFSLLHLTPLRGIFEAIYFLVQHGSCVHEGIKGGQRPIHAAEKWLGLEEMETCFQHGVLISDWYQILKPTYVSKALFNFTVISLFD